MMVRKASDQIQDQARQHSREFQAAYDLVHSLYTSNRLTEVELSNFANGGKIDQAVIALSLMSKMRIDVIERALIHGQMDQIVVIAKSIDLSWGAARALLMFVMSFRHSSMHQIEDYRIRYERLQSGTAKKVTEFYRLRERASLKSS